jgi:hypothetical protein
VLATPGEAVPSADAAVDDDSAVAVATTDHAD